MISLLVWVACGLLAIPLNNIGRVWCDGTKDVGLFDIKGWAVCLIPLGPIGLLVMVLGLSVVAGVKTLNLIPTPKCPKWLRKFNIKIS